MRPRGESISCDHETYVGHAGRQKPQWTQSSIGSPAVSWVVVITVHSPPTNRPGFMRPSGSNPSLTRFIVGNEAGLGPHTSTDPRIASGMSWTTSDPGPRA